MATVTDRRYIILEEFYLGALFDEAFRKAIATAIAAFDDVLVDAGVVFHGIVAIVAGHAKVTFWQAGGFYHSVLRKIMQGVGVQIFADVFDGIIGRHQFAAVGEIDAVDARVHVRGAAHEDVNFFGARFFQAVDASLAGGTADNGIVHHDDAFAFHEFADEVQLHADIKIANQLRGLEEAAADVMVADERHFKRNFRFERVTERGAVAAVRHGDDDVGFNGVLAGELAAHFDADFVNVPIGNGAVRAREINVFENAEGAAFMFGKCLDAGEAFLVDDDDFAGFDVADEFGVDQIQRAGFAGEDPGIVNLADAQGAEAVGVTHANKFLLGHDDERVGAFDLLKRVNEMVAAAIKIRLGHQVQNDFAIDGGAENGTAGFEFFAELGGVGEIAVVGDGDLAARAIHGERLGVAQMGRAGGGITGVADGHAADEAVEDFAVKNLRHETHSAVDAKLFAVTGDDAGAFLAAMLERIEAVVRQFGGVRMSENAEDTTIMFGVILHRLSAQASASVASDADGFKQGCELFIHNERKGGTTGI